MHEDYLTRLKKAKKQPLEAFLQTVFEHDPTDADFHDPIWAEVLQLIRDKVPNKHSYTVRLDEAARRNNCSNEAIRKAINAGKIKAIKSGRWLIDEKSLNQWAKNRKAGKINKAPKAQTTPLHPVSVRFGHEKGARLQVSIDHDPKFPGVTEVANNIREGTISQWSTAAILTSKGKSSRRFFLIEPGGDKQMRIAFGSFYVEGHFTYKERLLDSDEAYAAWRQYNET